MKSVQTAVDRWKSGTAAGQQHYSEGIAGTTVDVAARAIAAQGALLRNFTDSVVSGRWARGITESGGTANWKAKAQAKAANYGVGVSAGAPKFEASMRKLLPFLEQTVASLPAKNPGDINSSIARVAALIQALHQNRGAFKG